MRTSLESIKEKNPAEHFQLPDWDYPSGNRNTDPFHFHVNQNVSVFQGNKNRNQSVVRQQCKDKNCTINTSEFYTLRWLPWKNKHCWQKARGRHESVSSLHTRTGSDAQPQLHLYLKNKIKNRLDETEENRRHRAAKKCSEGQTTDLTDATSCSCAVFLPVSEFQSWI